MNEMGVNNMITKSLERYWTLNVPLLAKVRWRIVDEGDRWAVWSVPQNHPKRWRELANFSTETEAVDYVKSL